MTDEIEAEEYDAYETAKPGEPTFTIQGGDYIAPHAVQFWADFARAQGRAILVGTKVVRAEATFTYGKTPRSYKPTTRDEREADKLLRKATSAEMESWRMQAYQRGHEEQEGARANYQTDEPDSAAELDVRRERIKAAGQLNNAISSANEAADKLAEMQVIPEIVASIRAAVELLKLACNETDPRKGSERS